MWSGPNAATSRTTTPFSSTLTLEPDIPLTTGCPTAAPKSAECTPSNSSSVSPKLCTPPASTSSPSTT